MEITYSGLVTDPELIIGAETEVCSVDVPTKKN